MLRTKPIRVILWSWLIWNQNVILTERHLLHSPVPLWRIDKGESGGTNSAKPTKPTSSRKTTAQIQCLDPMISKVSDAPCTWRLGCLLFEETEQVEKHLMEIWAMIWKTWETHSNMHFSCGGTCPDVEGNCGRQNFLDMQAKCLDEEGAVGRQRCRG